MLRPGQRFTLSGRLLVVAVRVREPSAHLLTAVQMFGPGVRALQVVHADESFLRFPVQETTSGLVLAAAVVVVLGDGQDYAGVRVENPFSGL